MIVGPPLPPLKSETVNGTKEQMRCGRGGCSAPEMPLPMKAPYAGEKVFAGRGGCSAPETPMPMIAPSAAIFWRVWRRPALA